LFSLVLAFPLNILFHFIICSASISRRHKIEVILDVL
jgi:hypothetical protein